MLESPITGSLVLDGVSLEGIVMVAAASREDER